MAWRSLKPWLQLMQAQGIDAPRATAVMAEAPVSVTASELRWPGRERAPGRLAALLAHLDPLPPADPPWRPVRRLWFALMCIEVEVPARGTEVDSRTSPGPLLERIHDGLQACLGEGDLLVRLAPDRLLALLALDVADRPTAERALRLAGSRMVASASVSALACSAGAHLQCSVGAALFNGDQDSAESVVDQAAASADLARERGGNQCCLPEDLASRAGRSDLHSNLVQALDQQQFFLHYQAEVDRQGRTIGAEALLRWHYPDRGTFRAGDFIAAAEGTSVMAPLGAWVLDTACRELAGWAGDPARAALTMTVNLAAEQLATPGFVTMVCAILDRTGADPCKLILELTEHRRLEDLKAAAAAIRTLRELGVRFGLDNAGAGHSDIERLRDLPLNRVKINGQLLDDTRHAGAATTLRTVVEMSRRLRVDVLATRIECEAQRVQADRLGCQGYQGLLFGRPAAAVALTPGTAPPLHGAAALA